MRSEGAQFLLTGARMSALIELSPRNGGVVLTGAVPGAWEVLAATLIGRPIGILAAGWR